MLRSFHDGRTIDIENDIALIGLTVEQWVGSNRVARTLCGLAGDNPDEMIADLAAVATAKVTRLPLVTGQADLAALDPDVATVVLARQRQP